MTARLRTIGRGRLVRLSVLVGTSGLLAGFEPETILEVVNFGITFFPPISPKVSRLERANPRCQFSWRNGGIVLSSGGTL